MAHSKEKRQVRSRGALREYFSATRSPLVAFAVTLPMLVLYNIGLLVPGADEMNAVDLLTALVLRFAGLEGLLIINGALVLTSVVMIVVLFRKRLFRPGQWFLLLGEGLTLGLLLGFAVVSLLEHAHVLSDTHARRYSVMQALSLAAGAGYWEELVFRLLLVGGPIAIARRIFRGGSVGDKVRVLAVGVAAIFISACCFSLAHYVGSETFVAYSFWYRTMAGIIFALIFLLRGFAVVAYTHFLYDVVVML